MKRSAVPIALSLLFSLAACTSPGVEEPTPTPSLLPSPSASAPLILDDGKGDRPTMPEDLPQDMAYLYDFFFSERYDRQVSDEFSLTGRELPGRGMFLLYEPYVNQLEGAVETTADGDGMTPYRLRQYRATLESGTLLVGTHYYEPDQLEYLSYLWTDIPGMKTVREVTVGSSEADLLRAYPEQLYYLTAQEASPGIWSLESESDLSPSFDCAYTWQPYTQENNDCRDITFYLKDGTVAAIEISSPYELRYVYGYDRDAGLETANANRAALDG